MDRDVQATRWTFDAPLGTSVVALDLWRYASVLDAQQSAIYRIFADDRALESSPKQSPWELGAFDASDHFAAIGLRAGTIGVELACDEEYEWCIGDTVHVSISRAAVTLRDDAAPEPVGLPSGRMFAGSSLDGIVDARVAFRDLGGGVDGVELKVDGVTRSIASVGGPDCAKPYLKRVPCSLQGSATLTLDTAELSDGSHTVEFVLSDVAGNRGIAGPFGISVRTPLPGSTPVHLSPMGAPVAPLLTQPAVGVVSIRGSRTRRTAFTTTKIQGTLSVPDGTAVAGKRVEVRTRPLLGGAWSEPIVALTDSKGTFTLSLPRGPSREVRVAYGESAQTVQLVVAAPVRLRTDRRRTRNGRSVRFSGSVPGAGSARSRVELQAWAGR